MRDAYQMLQQKETELARVRHEVASLRIVAPLLSADSSAERSEHANESSEDEHAEARSESEATGTNGLFSFETVPRPNIWNVLKRGK